MLRRAEEHIPFNVQHVRSKRTHNVSMKLGTDTYYLSAQEAFTLADRLVDTAERVEHET